MASMTDHEIRAIALSSGLGRSVLAFDGDEILVLLRAANQREGVKSRLQSTTALIART